MTAPLKKWFIFFGDDFFAKLNSITFEGSSFKSIKFSGTIFDSLSVNGAICPIQATGLSWSYGLFVTELSILYHCGFTDCDISDCTEVFRFPKSSRCMKIVCSWNHSLFLSENGKCYFMTVDILQVVPIIDEKINGNAVDVECGDQQFVIITKDGRIYFVRPVNDTIEIRLLPVPYPISGVACGKEHTLLLTRCGKVYSLGTGSRGQLGHGDINDLSCATLLEALHGVPITSISAGGWHSAAISETGDLYMWGWNESGQLGLPCSRLQNTNKNSEVETTCCIPKIIDFKVDISVKKISCGSRHTSALLENDTVWTWGWNEFGQLGRQANPCSDELKPVIVPEKTLPIDIRSPFWHTLITCTSKEQSS